MKLLIIMCIVVAAVGANSREGKYTTKYDNTNIDDILKNRRLLIAYSKCLTNNGRCNPDGTELKTILPDALKTQCSKCSDRQREISEKVFAHLINKEPSVWNELEKLYDPTGEYKHKYCEVRKKSNTNSDSFGQC